MVSTQPKRLPASFRLFPINIGDLDYKVDFKSFGQMITSSLIPDCKIEQLANFGPGLAGVLGGNYHQKNSHIRALGQSSPTWWLA